MNHLLRQLAPISDEGWDLLDEEARQQVTVALAARRLVDFKGPNGWHYSATSLGRAGSLPSAVEGVSALQRVLLPLVELRAEFTVTRATLDDIDRGAKWWLLPLPAPGKDRGWPSCAGTGRQRGVGGQPPGW